MTIDFEKHWRAVAVAQTPAECKQALRQLAADVLEDAAKHFEAVRDQAKAHEMFPAFCLNEKAASNHNAAEYLRARASEILK